MPTPDRYRGFIVSLILTMSCISECSRTVWNLAKEQEEPWEGLYNVLDQGLKDFFLSMHNGYRSEEYTAINMNKLEWSDWLEQEAARWQTECRFEHQPEPVWGENQYRSNSLLGPEQTLSDALQAWHLEHYNIENADKYVDCCSRTKNTCCSFTQMVWANTVYIGCALKFCPLLYGDPLKVPKDKNFVNADFLTCYYYPPGNVLTEQPFQRGYKQCSNCPAARPDCQAGLCYFDTSSRC